jgi:hypothetical protein
VSALLILLAMLTDCRSDLELARHEYELMIITWYEVGTPLMLDEILCENDLYFQAADFLSVRLIEISHQS